MTQSERRQSRLTAWLETASGPSFAAYCIVAAFGTYFCMYAFRKPFTAGEFENIRVWDVGFKTILIASQVAGYTLSKFVGIKVVSEMPPKSRAIGILVLIAIAELALLLFAIVPPPWNFLMLFLNGLPLGMVFGLVLSFLEGRRMTETLAAGLCASFILASGVVKSVGRSLIVDYGVSEYWMPFATGLLFVVPLLIGVLLLSQIPPPNAADIAERAERKPMRRQERWSFFRRHAFGLCGLIAIYILLTVIRSIRDDFAVEIWNNLDAEGEPQIYAKSEMAVMIGVISINGAAAWLRSNRSAFLGSLGLILGGVLLVLLSLWGYHAELLSPFSFMVLIGLGTYVPYVAFHTTVFERLIAVFGERGNLGYLMYLADAMGYLGYVGVMLAKSRLPSDLNFLNLFLNTSLWFSTAAAAIVLVLFTHYVRTLPPTPATDLAPLPAPEVT